MFRKHRTLHIETLEVREVLSVNPLDLALSTPAFQPLLPSQPDSLIGPSAEEQEMLELINRMRIDPQGELNRLIKSFSPYEAFDPEITTAINRHDYPKSYHLDSEWAALSSVAPLAWNFSLYVAAMEHSFQMIQANEQSHQLPGEQALYERIKDAGYDPAIKQDETSEDFIVVASENVYAYGRPARSGFSAASYTHAAFALDWGVPAHSHRDNIMNPNFSEVGISMLGENNPSTKVGDWITTVDFASPHSTQVGDGAYLLGVIFSDLNYSGFYEAGEGISNVKIKIIPNNPDQETIEFSPYQAGGYQMFLENGLYSIAVSGPDFSDTIVKHVAIQGQNVKVDFIAQDVSVKPPVLDLNGAKDGANFSTYFMEYGSQRSIVAPDATLDDEDSGFLSYAIITLETRTVEISEYLAIDTSGTGLKSTYDSSTGVMLIFGDASLDDYLTVLKSLEYGNSSQKTDLSDRVVSFVVSDGINLSEVVHSYISIRQQTLETLTVSDVKIEEGDNGMTEMVFQFELSDIPRNEVYFEYEIADGTAVLGTHFFGEKSGAVFFEEGSRTALVRFEVPADYLPGNDLEFSLHLTGIYGAECSQTVVTGTIWDDDTPFALGPSNDWSSDDLDLTDGRRRLYSFSPTKAGVALWEAILAEGSFNDVTMQLYKTNHEGDPLAEAVDFKGRARLTWNVEPGETYVLLVRGDVVLKSLKMTHFPLIIGIEDGNLEIGLTPGEDDVIKIDYENNWLWYNGFELPVRFADYNGFRFLNVEPTHLLQIVVPSGNDSTAYFDIDPDNPQIPGSTIQIGDFTKYEYVIEDESTIVRVHGTTGDDLFDFQNSIASLTTSTKKIFSISGGKIFEVYSNGGEDKALIFDTEYDDMVRFESHKAFFFGGGDTKLNISVYDFSRVDVSSIYGGGDSVYVVNTNNNIASLDERLVRRIEYDADNQRNETYCTWGITEAFVFGTNQGNSIIYLWSDSKESELQATPGKLVSTDKAESYKHTIYGYADVRWKGSSQFDGALTLYYDGMAAEQSPVWSQDSTEGVFYIPNEAGTQMTPVSIPLVVDLDFYFNGERKDIRTLPPPSVADYPDGNFFIIESQSQNSTQPISNQGPLTPINRVRDAVWFKNLLTPEDEDDDFFTISLKPLSVAEIALLYEDWNS